MLTGQAAWQGAAKEPGSRGRQQARGGRALPRPASPAPPPPPPQEEEEEEEEEEEDAPSVCPLVTYSIASRSPRKQA